jgi:hypothetical protein
MSAWRVSLGLVSAALVAAGVWLGLQRALIVAGVEPKPSGLATVESFAERLEALRTRERRAERLDIAYLGDSSVYNPKSQDALPARVAASTGRHVGGRRSARVYLFATPGLDSFEYFFLADRIALGRPDAALVCLNLASLSARWRDSNSLPQMSGLIAPSAIAVALGLPIEWIGLTSDRLLRNWALVRLVGVQRWHQLVRAQLRVAAARGPLDDWLAGGGDGPEARFAYRRRLVALRAHLAVGSAQLGQALERSSAHGYRARLAVALDGASPRHPTLQALRATLRALARERIATLVYVTPMNVEHMQALGVAEPGAFAATLATLASIAGQEGAYFADLHDQQPDRAFRDAGDHLRFRGENPPIDRLGEELGRLLGEMLKLQLAEGR